MFCLKSLQPAFQKFEVQSMPSGKMVATFGKFKIAQNNPKIMDWKRPKHGAAMVGVSPTFFFS